MQQSNGNNTNENLAPDQEQVSSGALFDASLLLLFITLCVFVPLCCAMQQQNSTNTLVTQQQPIPTRKVDFTVLLSKTMMQVESTHLIMKDDSLRITGDIEEMSTMDKNIMYDVELAECERSEKHLEDAKSMMQSEDGKSISHHGSSHQSSSQQQSLMTENMVLQLPKDVVN